MMSTDRRKQAAWGVIAALTAMLTLVTLYTIFAIRTQSETNGQVVRHVMDCTTPGGECFERGQRQTADAVADISRVSLYAAACADRDGPQTVTEIQQCVIARLAEDDSTP